MGPREYASAASTGHTGEVGLWRGGASAASTSRTGEVGPMLETVGAARSPHPKLDRGTAPATPTRRLLCFLALTYAGAWLVCLPLWLSGQGLSTPYAVLALLAMMAVPALAALLTHRLLPDGRRLSEVLGLRPGPFRRWWPYALASWFGPGLLSALALGLAAAVGVLRVDLREFSGYAEALRALAGGRPLPMPVQTLVAITVLQVVLVAPWLNAVPALGEEIGWRGMLRDLLRTRPRWQLVVVTGAIWGLWHTPVILLGYNYPGLRPVVACAFMVVFCTLLAALLEFLRAGAGNVYVTALAHGSLNAAAGLGLLVVAAGHPVDNATTGLLGWTGWLVLGLTIIALVAARRLDLSGSAEEPAEPASASVVDDVQR